MIKFISTDKRKLDVMVNEEKICELDLVFSPVTNKFTEITKFIEDCSEKLGSEFDTWFKTYIEEYKASNFDHTIILKHIPNIKNYVEKYLSKYISDSPEKYKEFAAFLERVDHAEAGQMVLVPEK